MIENSSKADSEQSKALPVAEDDVPLGYAKRNLGVRPALIVNLTNKLSYPELTLIKQVRSNLFNHLV